MVLTREQRSRPDVTRPAAVAVAVLGAVLLLGLLALGSRFPVAAPDLQPGQVRQPSTAPLPSSAGVEPGEGLPADLPEPSPLLQVVRDVASVFLTLALVAVLGLGLLLLVRALLRSRGAVGDQEAGGEPEPELDLAALQQLVSEGQSRIEVDGDANRAVIRCWRGLEELAAAAGVPRDPSQTAREYTLAVLTDARLPSRPSEQLADLYGQALFSDQLLPPASVAVATEALAELAEAAGGSAEGGTEQR